MKEMVEMEPRLKIYGSLDAGVTFNPDAPKDRQNFGRLFTDRANELMLNQFFVTVERTLKPALQKLDWGFKLQALLLGSDSRALHLMGEFDNSMHEIVQPALLEAFFELHLPILTAGGVDVKAGQFITPLGAESIPSPGNFFYSHSYIYNFGVPIGHLGIQTTTHAAAWLDIYAGWTRGVNAGWDDNNEAGSFLGGIGFNFLGDKLTILATTSIGPENDGSVVNAQNDFRFGESRYLSTITAIWKANDKLTVTSDLNYAVDAAVNTEAYGVAEYLTYAVNENLSFGARVEVWRDDDGFFALQGADNDDVANLQRGIVDGLDPRTVGGGDTTYGAITFGGNIRFSGRWKHHVVIRPELRYDRAIGGSRNKPFDDSSDSDQFTAAIDVVIAF
jgi:putative OmpL-like beta-barrel porin-2